MVYSDNGAQHWNTVLKYPIFKSSFRDNIKSLTWDSFMNMKQKLNGPHILSSLLSPCEEWALTAVLQYMVGARA